METSIAILNYLLGSKIYVRVNTVIISSRLAVVSVFPGNLIERNKC